MPGLSSGIVPDEISKIYLSTVRGAAASAVSTYNNAKYSEALNLRFENLFVYGNYFFPSVAKDLYEEIPKEICIPERNKRYDMLTEAKFACADDTSCSGLVEAPKRRNQNKKFGKHWTFTEREFFLCDYPVSTKRTDDTLFFRKKGM